jgi:hypothetical protein
MLIAAKEYTCEKAGIRNVYANKLVAKIPARTNIILSFLDSLYVFSVLYKNIKPVQHQNTAAIPAEY